MGSRKDFIQKQEIEYALHIIMYWLVTLRLVKQMICLLAILQEYLHKIQPKEAEKLKVFARWLFVKILRILNEQVS